MFIWSYFSKSLSGIVLIVRGWTLLYSSYSIFSIMLSYDSDKLDMMCVIIFVSFICMFNFPKSLISTSSLVIQYSGYLVMLSNFYFTNFLCSLVLEDPVIGSIFSRLSPTLVLLLPIYSLSFFLLILSGKIPCILGKVLVNSILSCWEFSIYL